MKVYFNQINRKTLSTLEDVDKNTYNICGQNGLMDLEMIIEYYLKNGNFLNLKKGNTASNQILTSICEKYLSNQFNSVSGNESITEIIEEIDSNTSIINRIDSLSVKQLALFNGLVRYRFSTLSDRSADAIKSYIESDIGIQGVKFILSNTHKTIKNIQDLGISTICEIYDFINSFNEIIDKVSNYSDIDKIFVELFKNAFDFEICIEHLKSTEKLNPRSLDICVENKMQDLQSMVIYFWANDDFLKLRNCGQKLNLELIELCRKYELTLRKSIVALLGENPIKSFIQKINDFSIKQKSLFNNILQYRFSKLSVRSSDALNGYMQSDISLQGVLFILSQPESELRNIRHVGVIRTSEINDFVNSLLELINTVSNCPNEADINIHLFNSFLIQKFSLSQTILDGILSPRDDFSYGLPIFRTLNALIENDILFEYQERHLFTLGFNYYADSDVLTLDQLAQKIELSRQRIRHLRLILLKKLPVLFSFLSEIEMNTINLYGIDLSKDYIVIEQDLVNEINRNEHTNFNSQFVLKILSVIMPDRFVLIGDEKSVLFNMKNYGSFNWQNTYLISKKCAAVFDFEKLIENIDFRLSERIEEDYSFNFQTYLLDFQKENCWNLLDNISQIAEYIVFNEFELSIDTYDNILFNHNKIKQVYEFSYEALEKLGKPSKVDAIYQKVIEHYPDYMTDKNGIKASMRRYCGFVPIGRTGVFGLKKWETEIDDFKGGTIRDIAEEFLEGQAEPKHIDKIAEFVNAYRNTTSKNIYANLIMDDSKRFVFYRGQMIGLSAKKYSSEKYGKAIDQHIERKTWEERFSDLQKFAEENDGLPKSNSKDKEIILYRFMYIQLNRSIKNQIDHDKASRINELVNKYKNQERKRKIP